MCITKPIFNTIDPDILKLMKKRIKIQKPKSIFILYDICYYSNCVFLKTINF